MVVRRWSLVVFNVPSIRNSRKGCLQVAPATKVRRTINDWLLLGGYLKPRWDLLSLHWHRPTRDTFSNFREHDDGREPVWRITE
jgi:hypothetical protein